MNTAIIRSIVSSLRYITLLAFIASKSFAAHTEISGPTGSGTFGSTVKVLSNGNIVVTDPTYSIPSAASQVGAIYLYSPSGTLISSLTGSSANDQVGAGGTITELTNGNYVVSSPFWNGSRGAVTWGSATSGVSGVVSSSNSLVGSSVNDGSGQTIVALTNGNYVVASSNWDNGGSTDAGAVTWGNGATGVTGVISSSNSLVGTNSNDRIGSQGVTKLTNGNYVVGSQNWQNGAVGNAGAVTWGNGSTGITGAVSTSNSFVGSTSLDLVGGDITALTNGNYVIVSSSWSNGGTSDVGAVTWRDGSAAAVGVVSAANSLIGSTVSDFVGIDGVTALTNGNYVVHSRAWDNGGVVNAGAVTWGNGTIGTTGVVSSSNSVVGSTASDNVGVSLSVALTNGNYAFGVSSWDNSSVANTGAVVWGNGTTGTTGVISASNALVGTTFNDNVGSKVIALTNGNYVTGTSNWDNGSTSNVGAVTWGNGTTGTFGAVTTTNSLHGTTASDQVGAGGSIVALENGNYVVGSSVWDNGSIVNAGAATWGNGTTGITGPVTTSNSLFGSTASDLVSTNLITLENGNYCLNSPDWDNGITTNVGAVTWGNGSSGTTGAVSASNSFVGTTASDAIGDGSVPRAQDDGNFVIFSGSWDNGSTVDAGAVTLLSGSVASTGTISVQNSVVGTTSTTSSYDPALTRLIVGRPTENKVSIFSYIPSLTTAASASPSTAGVGQTVTFSAQASVGVGTIAYSWAFGDGTTGTGSSATHAYTSAGTYTATVTASTLDGQTLTSSVNVAVTAPTVGSGNDSDGDGFSDAVEIAAGSDPSNASSTPTGGAVPTIKKLKVSNLNIKLNFSQSNKDKIEVIGTVPLKKGFKARRKQFTIDIGGIPKSAKLGSTGNSKAIKLDVNSEKKLSKSRKVQFTGTFNRGSFSSFLNDEGLLNANLKNSKVKVNVTVILDGNVYLLKKSLKYTAKAGKLGEAK